MTVPSIKYCCPKCGKEEMSITDSCSSYCNCTLKFRDGKEVQKSTRMKRIKSPRKKVEKVLANSLGM